MALEAIVAGEQYYILATSARIDDRKRVLKHGDTFAVFDRFGDLDPLGPAELGIYHQDTRFLSRLALRLEDGRPLLLDSTVKENNAVFTVDLMNPDLVRDGGQVVPHGALHVERAKTLFGASCHERLRFRSYAQDAIEIAFTLAFGADFADLFEARGTPRARRGRLLLPAVQDGELVFAYHGLDDVVRRTRVALDPAPEWRAGEQAAYRLRLRPQEEAAVRVAIAFEVQGRAPVVSAPTYEAAVERVETALRVARAPEPDLASSNEQFDVWVRRSLADVRMLCTETPYGPYPYAGVPWFSTVFGRDGLWTALECLWIDPGLARGVLRCLAALQADEESDERDAQPGKILHEMRAGEMAALGEIPFGRYYGSIDATPLFVVLAGAYCDHTGDVELVRELWPNVERALEWIDRYGDADGDGFYEYARRTPSGLVQQGWKDSDDSVFHADGRLARPPIALCEVQGYVFAAKRAAARLARRLGAPRRAEALEGEAEDLRARFEETFWCEELSTYALALDGEKRPCRVVTSNAGHCLWAGIASEERARRVARTLCSSACFSGWGVRTVALDERRYNPMSYHNGSVWPHDNAILAAGFARYGLKEEATRILGALFAATQFVDLHRLPELYCGFQRRPDEGPTLYPVACSPQAWAAGSVFLCLQACLGLEVLGHERTVRFSSPVLPPFLERLRVGGLRVGEGSVDLALTRHGDDVGIHVLGRSGRVRIVSQK